MPEPEESQPLLDSQSTTSRSSSKRSRRASRILTSAWGTTLKVETVYTPKPLCPLSPTKVGVMVCILITEMCERLTYNSVIANLILFCTSILKYSTNDAVMISLIFSGTSYLTPIIGGYVADAHIGRFNAIFASALVYVLGLFLLPWSAVDFQQVFNDDKLVMTLEWKRIFFLLGLALVSVGTGGIRANIGPFGAHQVQDLGSKAVHTFFFCYYWFVNIGAFLAFAGVATVQQFVGFEWGFFIPLLVMLLAIFIFLIPRKDYRCRLTKGSMLAASFAVCWQSCRRSSRRVQGSERFLDTARKEYGGSYSDETVDGVISVMRILPIFVCLSIFYVVHSQTQSTFFIQGERMDTHVNSVEIPVAMLNAFSTAALIFIIPLLDRAVYFCLLRVGRPLSRLLRIGIGFILAALSMVAAALVEVYRKEHLGFQQTVGDETFTTSNVTIFLQVPQYILVGCGEAFTSISGLEFAYSRSPVELQSLMTGLFMATVGLGNYLAVAVLRIVELATEQDPWFPDEINNGHAEYLFFLLACLIGVFFFAYSIAAKLYKHVPVEDTNLSAGKETTSQGSASSSSGSRETISQDVSSQDTNSQETSSQAVKSRENNFQEVNSQETSFQEVNSQETSFQEVSSQGNRNDHNHRLPVTVC